VTFVVLLGAPGAGKGTQATILHDRLGLAHVATGDLFRAAVRDGTALGAEADGYMSRGELVPDDVTVRMLLERLDEPDATAGVILDGFPRTRPQAEALDHALAERRSHVDAALLIDVSRDELVRRLSGRWVCADGSHVYHETEQPPTTPGICDVDGSPLEQRDDDRPETIRARLDGQLGALAEVVDHYRAIGALRIVDGARSVDEVADAVEGALASARS
jgi:adenylate kinase